MNRIHPDKLLPIPSHHNDNDNNHDNKTSKVISLFLSLDCWRSSDPSQYPPIIIITMTTKGQMLLVSILTSRLLKVKRERYIPDGDIQMTPPIPSHDNTNNHDNKSQRLLVSLLTSRLLEIK